MTVCVGIDGCRAGWIAVISEPSGVTAQLLTTVEDLVPRLSPTAVVAIDVPIGLVDAGARDCDRAARQRLGTRRGSSVFPAPIRPVLTAATHADACEICARIEGKRMSLQAFAIVPKVREVDALLRGRPWLQSVVREVHPELCFAAWNGGVAMAHAKKTAAGRAERERLIEMWRPGLHASLRTRWTRAEVARDDINDALAALWTAERIAAATAERIPSDPEPRDAVGLPMRMWA
jgi:predicted RNase H-like nuclease